MKLKSVLTAFFVVYIVALSFVPLVHDTILAQNSWVGYGTGAYAFQSQHYFVLFNDPFDGSSKPHIHVNPDFAPAARISLLEFSDWTSWVNEFNLFNEFNFTIRTVRTAPRVLDITYTRPEIVIHKIVEVSPDSVKVTLNSSREFKAHLEIWRWVMTSINGISIRDTNKPLAIAATSLIEFTFEEERPQSLGHGSIRLSALPAEIMIWPHEKGFNKITIDFVNSRMVFTVAGAVEPVGIPSSAWSYADLPYVLPVVAISVVALYLLVDKYGRKFKNRATGRSS